MSHSEPAPLPPLPLDGVNVVDFGQYIAGPAVGMILADFGATVIHVDPPTGPMWDNPANAILNRNKLCLQLDLKTEQGVVDAHRLIAQADIVIENFRPGVLARLGVDLEALTDERTDLIALSVPGFASNDALRRDWRAFESVIAAQSGVFTDMGLNRVLMGINPSFSPLPLGSAYGTMLAASSVVLALQSREITGRGDYIEVPLAASLMEGLSYNSIHIDNFPARYKTQREKEIERRRASGEAMDVSYDDLQELLDPFYRSYLCKDKRYFYVVCPSHRFHAKRCLQTLGLYEELIADGLLEEPNSYKPMSEWTSNVSLGVYPLPKFWADKIAERMKAVFSTRTSGEWEKIFGRGKFPGAPQRWLQEWIYDDHAETTGLIVEVNDPTYGPMQQPGPLAWMHDHALPMLEPQGRRASDLTTALATMMMNPRPVFDEVKDPAPWLDGVKILDLCNVIAGPHSVAYLARFGAEVIKIDPASPLYDCWNTVIFGLSHMRSKQSVLLDIRHGDGRVAFEALVKSVDVVVWNATDSQVAQMGLTEELLSAINPEVIFCQLDCFGGIKQGLRTNYLGYDDVVQASTGIMHRFGGGMEAPEEHAHVGTIDVMCGFGGSLGIATALYQKYKTGRIGRPRTSLAALTGLAQIPFCFDYKGRPNFDEPAGREAQGYHALERFYPTSDGTLMLAAQLSQMHALSTALGLPDLERAKEEFRIHLLAEVFAKRSAAHWVDLLQGLNIAAAQCDSIDTLRDEHCQDAGVSSGIERGSYSFSRYADHPAGRTVIQLDPYAVRPRHAPIRALTPSEQYGASTRAVLQSVGYDDVEIDRLIKQGDAAERWSDEYLPT
ncbi:carnitine dehydratase [Litorivicinus lipolyticus]|uniref:Carnitine dehydratase n=3 Tax=root TaxID=1 RepID=A0A5Q2QET6_9GAMM|nr:CoA transferase [Litorivicinus lipolyticus]QGG80881.1 carnitine dehydratase [Litorivicinus lipolyticus]